MSNKLFVGNLAWSVTSEKLYEVFSAFGPVVEAKVLVDRATNRSRGFGFVTFQNEADADRATAEMHNQEIDGRPVRCDNTQKPEKKERRNDNRENRNFAPREDRGGYARRDDNREGRSFEGRSFEDRPRRDFARRDDRPRMSSYDNYNVADFPPDPDKMSRNNRRDNRRKDRNHDDDDRW